MSGYIQALAVSDTHGNRLALEKIARRFGGKMQYIFHLGDYVTDASWLRKRLPDANVLSVRGNCDWSSSVDLYEDLYIGGVRLILCHGHTLDVKWGVDQAVYYAQEHDANAILFGHTHVPLIERHAGITLINPGSAGEPRNGRPTVAVMLIGQGKIIPKIVTLTL